MIKKSGTTFFLRGMFTADKVADVIDCLHGAKDGDRITIRLFSEGGGESVFHLIDAIKASKAEVTTHIVDEISGSAFLVWLAGQERLIYTTTDVIIRVTKSANSRKFRDNEENALYREFLEMDAIPFFSEKEIDELMESGDEIRLRVFDVIERIKHS